MTAITFAGSPVLAVPRTRLRLTARGRRVVAAIAALPLAAVLAVAALGGVSAFASSDAVAAPVEFATITVLPGDTLWSLAALIAPEADPRDVVQAIARLNMLSGGEIFVGQKLAIPAEFRAP